MGKQQGSDTLSRQFKELRVVFPFYIMEAESGRHELSCLPWATLPESPISPGVAAIPALIGYRGEALNRAATA